MAHKYLHLALRKLKIPTFNDAGSRRSNNSADFKIRYEGEEKGMIKKREKMGIKV